MENILKKPYEISLWDDDLVFKIFAAQKVVFSDTLKYEKDKYYYLNNFQDPGSVSGAINQFVIDGAKEPTEGRQYYTYGDLLDEQIGSMKNKDYGMQVLIVQYYKERKICIIGSNTMDTPIRATSGKLVSNVNGSNTLTFNMFSRYYDEDAEQFFDNPYLKLLVNERKVKLRYGALGSEDCKWYDFVIKDVKENSENKTFNYTCKDLFINELSKSGFNIVLDPELENNMGNITYLAEKILEESDWKLGMNNAVITQTKEEPLYEIVLKDSIRARDMQDKETEIEIDKGKTIYAFYNVIANEEPYFQFLYREDGKYEKDDDHVITNSSNYYIENVEYINGLPSFGSQKQISPTLRGDKLIR
jgi:hypothetical protein